MTTHATTMPSAGPAKRGLRAVLGGASLLLVLANLAGITARAGMSDRTAFIILAAAGFTMCALGPLGRGASVGWLHPLHIAGYLLGGLALLLVAGVLLGLPLPLVSGDRGAILVLAGLMAVKIGLAAGYPLDR